MDISDMDMDVDVDIDMLESVVVDAAVPAWSCDMIDCSLSVICGVFY